MRRKFRWLGNWSRSAKSGNVMKSAQKIAFVPLLLLCMGAGDPADVSHDAHPLTATDVATFLPLVCLNARKSEDRFNCDDLPSYPREKTKNAEGSEVVEGSLKLQAIAYGSF